jgi:hypothetical protein
MSFARTQQSKRESSCGNAKPLSFRHPAGKEKRLRDREKAREDKTRRKTEENGERCGYASPTRKGSGRHLQLANSSGSPVFARDYFAVTSEWVMA